MQPDGVMQVLKPDIIDIYPVTETEDGTEYITGAETLDEGRTLTLQQAALATIWQRGLDPVSPDVGVRWAQTLGGELSPVTLMQDISDAVGAECPGVSVEFTTVRAPDGSQYLAYTLREAV